MDFFLAAITLFLLTNVAVVVAMLRRINLHNDSVLAWEQQQAAAPNSSPVHALQALEYSTVTLPEAA
ncbi:hypothetical protein [Rheinheimera gaetbuli]